MLKLNEFIHILNNNDIICIPTETVYGLAAKATSSDAVAKIYNIKGRPSFNPLICHVSSINMAMQYAEFNDIAINLVNHFWAGALTLVLPLKDNSPISSLVTAGLNTIALRMPNHKITLKLIENLGYPIAAPSANISGRISPTSPDHVRLNFGEQIPILEGGKCKIGIESTIIGFDNNHHPVLLRAGGIAKEDIETIINIPVNDYNKHSPINAPGQLTSHYAPLGKIRLNATEFFDDEAILTFGDYSYLKQPCFHLSLESNIIEATAKLFDGLHYMDSIKAQKIAITPIPMQGLGVAINDRLQRAAAPR
jgi:L-threonylcarbamoyladenylate synthase